MPFSSRHPGPSHLRALSEDGVIAVVAPASPPADTGQLQAGLERLRATGLTVETAYHLDDADGYLAAADSVRARDFNSVLHRDDIRTVLCVRGGYGSLRLLEEIDYGSLARDPKVIVGYSDVTALHLAVLARTGLPGLSAAMVATDWHAIGDAEAQAIIDILGGRATQGLYSDSGVVLEPTREGVAEGRSIGGNLSVLCKLIGTVYFPDPTGAILFIEEVGEPPYRIDGLLAQLKLARVLERIGGLVVGGITEADPPANQPSFTVEEVVEHYSSHVQGPVATGLRYGHFQPKEPMPVGVRMRLEVARGEASLKALEQLTQTR